jgi:uncharacterized damage-inducible protein DinB
MSLHDIIDHELKSAEEFLERSTRVLQEEHSSFAPSDGVYTVAQQMAHIAVVLEWFVDGAFSATGFDMNFEEHEREVRAVSSLTAARALVKAAFENARRELASKSLAELEEPFPAEEIMQGPRWSAVFGMVDHTSHHRGALTIYSRQLGLTPKMPYMEL